MIQDRDELSAPVIRGGLVAGAAYVKRVERIGAARVYFNPHNLTGCGTTPAEAQADYERRVRELCEDGLEPDGPMPRPRLTQSAAITSPRMPSAPPIGYLFGCGMVAIRERTAERDE